MGLGFVIHENLAYNDYGVDVVFSRWKKRGMKQYFDLFFLDCDESGAIKFINSFPLTCSTCYQKRGESITATEKALKHIHDMRIEVNNKSVPLSILFQRVRSLSKKGWVVGHSVIGVFMEKMEFIMENPEKFSQKEYRYVKTRSCGYFTAYTTRVKLIKDFLTLLNNDNMVLAFMSRNNKVLKAVKQKYNKRLCWKKMLKKFKRGE